MNDSFIVITWTDNIQELMEKDGFAENACLINDEPFLTEYGSSAYFVRGCWLDKVLSNIDN
ncbi:MAG TPA: hypothetical protein PKD00_03235 [Burkholderiales bacterium]|nr:hypothetical protein [Burkholderiales bacterium]